MLKTKQQKKHYKQKQAPSATSNNISALNFTKKIIKTNKKKILMKSIQKNKKYY